MLIIYSKFGKLINPPYICIIKVKQVVTIKNMKASKVYIIEFRNSEGKRDYQCYAETNIKKVFDVAYRYCKANKCELIGVREA